MQLVEALVHLQLLPEGALRLTRQIRESVQPPLLIWHWLEYCGQFGSTAVMPYSLWLPKKDVCMGFWRTPELSTLSSFLLRRSETERERERAKLREFPYYAKLSSTYVVQSVQ